MIELLKSIVSVITTVITFFIHSIESLISFFLNIPTYATFLINSVNVLPSVVIPFAIASISLYVMIMVIGRN